MYQLRLFCSPGQQNGHPLSELSGMIRATGPYCVTQVCLMRIYAWHI